MVLYNGSKIQFDDGYYEVWIGDEYIRHFDSFNNAKRWIDDYCEYKDEERLQKAEREENDEPYTRNEMLEWDAEIPLQWELSDFDEAIDKYVKELMNPNTGKRKSQELGWLLDKTLFYRNMKSGVFSAQRAAEKRNI